jgi:GT2 family glycosyltransferase
VTEPRVACIVLTLGDRREALVRALNSVRAQHGEPVELIVVGNGGDPGDLGEDVRVERLPDNVGIPGGRNAGAALTDADVLLFLDDDGYYPDAGTVEHLRRRFRDEADLAVVSMRIEDPDGAVGQQRHVPRLGRSDPLRGSDVTTFLGGASAIRAQAFHQAGGYDERFFFGHEESDLAWRMLDHGWRIAYDPSVVMMHPSIAPVRIGDFRRLDGRNRMLLARKNLPLPLRAAHMGTWAAITLARVGPTDQLSAWWQGVREGAEYDVHDSRRMTWSTAWRMTRLGRPPFI